MDRVLSSRIVFSVASTLAMRLIGTLVGGLDPLLSGTDDRSPPYLLRLLPFPSTPPPPSPLIHILCFTSSSLSFRWFCFPRLDHLTASATWGNLLLLLTKLYAKR
ncbi:hypothetical protein EDD85DRAFT_172693 [Armillaria nabsnona]|nr:hypothetical protein EDD85DRAFT_172693 [Armillaria nabsnona]